MVSVGCVPLTVRLLLEESALALPGLLLQQSQQPLLLLPRAVHEVIPVLPNKGTQEVNHRKWTTGSGPQEVDHRKWTRGSGPLEVDHWKWTTGSAVKYKILFMLAVK